MNQTKSFFTYATLAFLLVFVGVMVGAGVGSYAGYSLARRGNQEALAVVQPVSAPTGGLASDGGKAATDTETEPDTTATPAPQPTTVPEVVVPATTNGDAIVTAVSTVQPATVEVLTQYGSGSGVIISEEGYIVTNYHVVEGSRRFAVKYARGEQVEATLIGAAPDFDLAVLKVEGDLPGVAAWGDSSAIPLGGPVIAIGSALGEYQNTVTTGILSGYNRTLDTLFGLLQTDAAINHGNSGGPLVNTNGEVIGINTMVVRGGQSQAEGLGFAIPSNMARGIVRQIIERGYAERPYMGVDLITLNSQIAAEVGVEVTDGAFIRDIVPNGAAAQAGIQAGDVITAINGRTLTDRDTLQMIIMSSMPGESVTVTVLRNGETFDVTMALGAA
jgi:2-alkenal reductase